MNKIERIVTLSNPLSEFLGTIVVVLIIYFGGTLILGSKSVLSSEEFIAYLIIFSQILVPAKSITSAYYNIRKASGSINRINELLTVEDTIPEKENALDITDFKESVEIKNVSFKYEDNYVLKNVNLKIEKGKTVALVGESGSGKSTLVDLIPRFYDIEEGEILIDGVNIKDYKIKSLRELMGNVNQVSILFNDTIENNIAFGVEKYDFEEVVASSKVANAYDFIEEKPEKFQTNIGDSGGKLSGGQKQRLSIARAVLKNPPILILDEATSALDTESEKLVQDALDKLMKNRTTIVIAHRLSTVKNADEICVMQKGEITERGKHDELIEKNGIYKRLCDLQMF
jgi:ABC-type multidrug transport system fused ATPase/permease subunit